MNPRWIAVPYYLHLLHFNPKTMSLLRYPKVIPYININHFRIIRFWIMLQIQPSTSWPAMGNYPPAMAPKYRHPLGRIQKYGLGAWRGGVSSPLLH